MPIVGKCVCALNACTSGVVLITTVHCVIVWKLFKFCREIQPEAGADMFVINY